MLMIEVLYDTDAGNEQARGGGAAFQKKGGNIPVKIRKNAWARWRSDRKENKNSPPPPSPSLHILLFGPPA